VKADLGVKPEPVPAGERQANRRERREFIRSLPRALRLGYGFGQWRRTAPGEFAPPARPRVEA